VSSLKKNIAQKAVKATTKHTVHGTASKLKRSRVRSVTLLGFGAAMGALATRAAGRSRPHRTQAQAG